MNFTLNSDSTVGTTLDSVAKAHETLMNENNKLKQKIAELESNSCDNSFIKFLDQGRLPIIVTDLKLLYDKLSLYGTPTLTQFPIPTARFDKITVSVAGNKFRMDVRCEFNNFVRSYSVNIYRMSAPHKYKIESVDIDFDKLIADSELVENIKEERNIKFRRMVAEYDEETKQLITSSCNKLENSSRIPL
jgi:hypothetical protein